MRAGVHRPATQPTALATAKILQRIRAMFLLATMSALDIFRRRRLANQNLAENAINFRRNPVMEDTRLRVLPSPNPNIHNFVRMQRSELLLPTDDSHSTRHAASFTPNTRF
jgi:hypothetical protein